MRQFHQKRKRDFPFDALPWHRFSTSSHISWRRSSLGKKPHTLKARPSKVRSLCSQLQFLLKIKKKEKKKFKNKNKSPVVSSGPNVTMDPKQTPAALLTLGCLSEREQCFWNDCLETKWIHGIWCDIKIIKHDTHKIQIRYHNLPNGGLLDSECS